MHPSALFHASNLLSVVGICCVCRHFPVNHQYLKSFAACRALRNFLRSTVAEGMEVFSLLKPLHDYRIYRLLQRYPQVLPDIHSCNIIKPWCRRCPKCAYVWINLVAIFGEHKLRPIFHGQSCTHTLTHTSRQSVRFDSPPRSYCFRSLACVVSSVMCVFVFCREHVGCA